MIRSTLLRKLTLVLPTGFGNAKSFYIPYRLICPKCPLRILAGKAQNPKSPKCCNNHREFSALLCSSLHFRAHAAALSAVAAALQRCLPGDEAHGQAVLVLHRLLRQVVGLLDAVECASSPRTHGEAGEQGDQDGLHHHHGDVFAHAGARPAAEGLEETVGHLQEKKKRLKPCFVFFFVF